MKHLQEQGHFGRRGVAAAVVSGALVLAGRGSSSKPASATSTTSGPSATTSTTSARAPSGQEVSSSTIMYLGEDSASVPEITTMTDWLQRTHPGAPVNLFVVEAFSAGLLFQTAMSEAGPDPTQTGLAAAIRGVDSFDADGLITQTDPGNKVPPVCNLIAGVRDAKFIRIDPPTTGFECNGTFHPYSASS